MANILSDAKKQQLLPSGSWAGTLRRIEAATGVRRETAGAYLKAPGSRCVRPGGGATRRQIRPPTVTNGLAHLIPFASAWRVGFGRGDAATRFSRSRTLEPSFFRALGATGSLVTIPAFEGLAPRRIGLSLPLERR